VGKVTTITPHDVATKIFSYSEAETIQQLVSKTGIKMVQTYKHDSEKKLTEILMEQYDKEQLVAFLKREFTYNTDGQKVLEILSGVKNDSIIYEYNASNRSFSILNKKAFGEFFYNQAGLIIRRTVKDRIDNRPAITWSYRYIIRNS
jgi:hypothetical protein